MTSRTVHVIRILALVGMAVVFCAADAQAQCELEKFLGSNGERAGHSVDISGDWAVAGAIFRDRPGFPANDNVGGVLVFQRNDAGTPTDPRDDIWTFHSALMPNDPQAGEQFGFSVSINGTYLIVGSPLKGLTGAAYVFRYNGTNWVQQAKLLPPAGTANEAWFGYSVAIAKGPTNNLPFVVIGAPQANPNGIFNGGSAFVYRKDANLAPVWNFETTLVPTDVAQGDRAGWSVAASFDTGNTAERIIIGAPQASLGFGAAYVYLRVTGWSQLSKLTGCTATSGLNFGPGQFGYSVSIAKSETLGLEQIVVGAPFCNRGFLTGGSVSDTGTAYVYSRNLFQWDLQRTLTESGGNRDANDNFGRSVATSGDAILVGIYGSDVTATNAGAANLFYRQGSSWLDAPLAFHLRGSNVTSGARMGQSVALDGRYGLVGAHLDAQGGSGSGAAYLIGVGPDTDGDGIVDTCDNCPFDSNPNQADADNDGAGDVCDICPGFDDWEDPDGDGLPSGCDNCPDVANVDQADVDGDGIGDACDNCPFVANGPLLSTCVAGAITPCATDQQCDTSAGAGDGNCAVPLGFCVGGMTFHCTNHAHCDSSGGAGDGVCAASQADGETVPDFVGDLCDNCPNDTNPNQADFNGNGLGDVCDPFWNIADELVPPNEPDYAAAVPAAFALATVTPPGNAFYYDKVFCAQGTPQSCSQWQGRWFANEPGVITIQWKDLGNNPIGDPVIYVITDSVGGPPPGSSYGKAAVRYFLDWVNQGSGAPVTIDTNFTLTIRYNSTFLPNSPPSIPSDVHVLAGVMRTETGKTGKIVFQYTDGPAGRLTGFEVVDIGNYGTPSALVVEVGRKLDIPPGADCKAHFITNALSGGFAAAWQRIEEPLDVWPIRPEANASNLVIGWYDVAAATGNCWHHSIRRYISDWPADPQPFVVVNDATPDPSIVLLPVGTADTYCQATVVFPGPLTAPRAQIAGGNQFSASATGYAVVRLDVKDSLPGATCGSDRVDVKFEVIRAFDHLTPYNAVTGEGVHEGAFAAPIGTQIEHPLQDSNTPLFPFGYRYSGQPFADTIYNDSGQIFPVNSSDVNGPLEVWWFQEGNYAPNTYWPFRVGQYLAQWPTGGQIGAPIVIASRSGAGSYPPGSQVYEVGVHGGANTALGWNPNDEHATLLPIAGSLRAFAVRDDNPWGANSGHPYTLIQYPEMLCSTGANPCIDEAQCGAGETCDPTGLWRMGVHQVIGEQTPYLFNYTHFPNQSDPTQLLPVLAGLPIDPLFPVNLGAAACRTGSPPHPQTAVVGDALWVDRTGGVWAVEQTTDGPVSLPSTATIYLWENWAADGGCQPWRDFTLGQGTPTPIVYRPSWPPAPPGCTYPTDPGCARPLAPGDRVDQSGQCGAISVLHDSVGIRIVDPTHEVSVPLAVLPSGVDLAALPPHLVGGELGGGGGAVPDRIRHVFGGSLFFRGIMSQRDRAMLLALSPEVGYQNAIAQLYNLSRVQLTNPLPNPVEKWVSIADQNAKPGWVTLAFQNDNACDPLPVSVEVWRVDCPAATGRIQVLEPTCPFNEKLVLQHAVDGGGRPELLIYEWQWSADYDPAAPHLATWNDYNAPPAFADGQGLREIIIEGASPFTLADSWWRARYRGYTHCPCIAGNCNQGADAWPTHLANDGTAISGWSDPQLAEGWVKRVIRGINPFDQRVADFHSSPVNTYVDMVGQAGIRFEAPVALNCTPANINALGLIEVYETVLRRARSFSIDVGVSYDPATLALLLVSAKVSDLYMLLGNEAFADASDPTIGLFADAGAPPPSYDPHAVFCFENQVPSVLEEELALLRGRDTIRPPDLDIDGRILATVYNRLPWNFTSGNGQVAYANNYQVTSVLDARAIYRQGHGDAYGHYLTALKKLYTLLRHPVFEWVISTESVLVGGQPVQVGFQYERAFAKAAAAKARTGAAITSLTFRQMFDADPAMQDGYPDRQNPDRAWGVSQWARRTGQGAYFDWVTANALLDDEDDNPAHQNTIRKIDRRTVFETREIAAAFQEIQSTMNKANQGLNPLGLAANVVPFGLNPSEIEAGKTHFEQIFERAVGALGNAVTAFDYANENTRRLRSQQDTVEKFQDLVDERERDFNGRLIEIFGRPYPQDVGLTGAYPPGYNGPDILHFDYVEPSNLLGETSAGTLTVTATLTDLAVNPTTGQLMETPRSVPFSISIDGLGLVRPAGWTTRPEVGEVQLARSEVLQALGRFLQALEGYEARLDAIDTQLFLLQGRKAVNTNILTLIHDDIEGQKSLHLEILSARRKANDFRRGLAFMQGMATAAVEALPKIVGIAGTDMSGPLRAVVHIGATIGGQLLQEQIHSADEQELRLNQDLVIHAAEQRLKITGWEQEYAIQQEIAALTQLFRGLPGMRLELHTLSESVNQATGRYFSAVGRGLRLLEQREAFRQRTARDIAQYRYRDMAFRVFRNDALQKYRAQFDLAAMYAYLTARAYDYETNLLGSDSQAGRNFLTAVVKERVLGVVSGGTPMVGNGLAGRLAELAANWAALKPQLGFNSLNEINRTFSLRWEMFRKPNSVAYDAEWRSILSGYVVSDLNALQEYRQFCQPLQPAVPNNPAIVIPLATTVQSGLNLFGWPSTGDATLPSDRFAIKLHSHAIRFSHYPGFPLNQQANVYLVPVGADIMRTPTCPEAPTRQWHLLDQTLPIPFPIGNQDLNTVGWMPWDALDGGSAAMVRRRLIPTVAGCAAGDPQCTDISFKLTGRSVWNTRWLLIIPGSELLGANPQQGIQVFIHGNSPTGTGVRDIQLLFSSYGYSGCISAGRDDDMEVKRKFDDLSAR